MVAPSIVDPFFRQLYNQLAGELDSRVTNLARGSALVLGAHSGLDAITTAMKYQEAVAYIQAIQFVIDLGIEIDNERYGTKNKENDGE